MTGRRLNNDQTFASSSSRLFANFVPGDSNSFARDAALELATSPRSLVRPLLLYGSCGSGKTHLLQAIANQVLTQRPDSEVLYLDSGQFIEDWMTANQGQTIDRLIRDYLTLDALLVDGIQFLIGKLQMLDLLDDLIEGGLPVAMACDRYPEDLEMPASLKARLMCVEVKSPAPEIGASVLQNKAAQAGLKISHSVAMFVASLVGSDMREVEGALALLIAEARRKGCEIDERHVRTCLKRHLRPA